MRQLKMISIFGLRIERKTDILAFAAFLIAITGTANQIFHEARGPNIKLFQPNGIIFHFFDYGNEKKFLRLGLRSSYINSARRDYTGVVLNEYIVFEINDKKYKQVWGDIYNFHSTGSYLNAKSIKAASPFPISGGNAESREVLFEPESIICGDDKTCKRDANFISIIEFIKDIESLDKINFILYSQVVGESRRLKKTCTIEVFDAFKDGIILNQWSSLACNQAIKK